MAIEVRQAWEAVDYEVNEQDTSSSTASVYYIVTGTDDDVEALNAVLEESEETYEGIPRQSANVDERLSHDWWKIEVKYAYRQTTSSSTTTSTSSEETQFGFDVSNGTRRVVNSIKERSHVPSAAPDSAGINDGDGIDIISPVCTFYETHYLSSSVVTTSWKKKVATMVGCINSSSFKGYSAGELLFIGCSGTRSGDSSSDKWQVTFKFAVQENDSSVSISGLDGNLSKRGWDILWVRYAEQEAGTDNNKMILRQPVAAYVEQVYEEANFSSLGI